ncbi:MAG: TatD family deoxyribonuclease [Sphingomonas sp.]|nr:MAG: TatD family deoxyribonuclease [Sphingomonas sp.]
MLADSHCHLNYPGLIEDQQAVLDRARARGVTAMLNISTRESEWDAVIATADREADVWATIGIHPNEADAHPAIDAARETGLPIVVHTRDAEEDTAAILSDEMGKGAYGGVIHCFTASAAFADKALELGLYISLSGIVTFKNARDLQAIAARLPIERLLIETDAPFLAPVPNRGKTGEPGFVADTAQFVADLRGVSVGELSQRTAENFHTLFAKTRLVDTPAAAHRA